MSRDHPVSWRNWARFARRLGVRGAPEAALRAGVAGLSAAGWALDRPAPTPSDTVIVIGHQRSGTTWLHRMLAVQPGAGAMPLHALLFPADAFQRPLSRLGRPAWLDRAQDRVFGALDPLHRIRLHEPEEDEFLLWGLFRSPMNALDRPWPPGRVPPIDGDDAALRIYAQAVARSVRRSGRRHVGKNPHFSHRVEALRAALPGVRLVQLVRHPEQAIPSRMSLIRAIWRRRFPDFRELAPHHVEWIYRTSVRSYLGGHGRADLDLAYADLVADPDGAVRRVHHALGLGPALRVAGDLRSGRTAHRYGLAEFGLDRDRLREELAPVYARWGFSPS